MILLIIKLSVHWAVMMRHPHKPGSGIPGRAGGEENLTIKATQDAYGHMMYDHLHNRGGYEIIERNDGFFSISAGPKMYFSPFEEWMTIEKQAMRHVEGEILDIGCGAGRHALYLQDEGHPVTAIDASPLAVQVSKARGVKNAQALNITRLSRRLGRFDTVLMMGNNFALLGTPKRAKWLLRRFAGMTSPAGKIIAFSRDPYQTDIPEHIEFHAWNKEHGRMAGEARIRVRYKKFVTPWIDFLMVSQQEMVAILAETPWQVSTFLDDSQGVYAAILTKQGNEKKRA